MASIYAKRGKLFARLKNEQGKWFGKITPFVVGQEAEAKRCADAAQAEIDARRNPVDAGPAPLSVEGYATEWLKARREKFEATSKRYRETGAGKVHHRAHRDDESRMRLHVLPHLGALLLADVRASHLLAWIHKLRTAGKLAGHTIRNIYGLVASMFGDAAIAGLIAATPCILKGEHLGESEETDGAGRYSREDFERMVGSVQLEEHARVFAAIGGFAGLRLGAVAGLRWGDLDVTTAPLAKLTSSRTYQDRPTKTQRPSVVPVHPLLAEMLTSWRHGWGRMFGRAPTADDPIVPRAPTPWQSAPIAHSKKSGNKLMHEILDALEIAPAAMPTHALRSTFVSLSLEDGARKDLIERITHPPSRKTRRTIDQYDNADYWPQLCGAVASIRITPRSGGSVCPLVPGGGKPNDHAPKRKATPRTVPGPRGLTVSLSGNGCRARASTTVTNAQIFVPATCD